ncbi:crustacyanin-A2 subunit-like isoform X1 [Rhodnius prolixus]|uniref:crustacyanin-A2 subunit-like isoform X1 n=1 Tax=Rhodnius prolixus TaxID=13249 RepID=UPI003D1878EF
MMYISTALLLVIFVSASTAGPVVKDQCQQVPIKHNFDPFKYYGKTWYTSHVLVQNMKVSPEDIACVNANSVILDNGIIRELDTAYMPKNDTFIYSELYINLESFTYKIGDYVAEARSIDKDQRPIVKEFYPVRYNIMDTDYRSYSIVYACVNVPDGETYSIYNILNRDPESKSVDPRIPTVLHQIGLKIEDFTPVDNSNCNKNQVV